MTAILDVTGLSVTFPDGSVAVDDVAFGLEAGAVLGIVGESGSGKTLTALSLMGLQPDTASAAGQVRLSGDDLLTLGEGGLAALRGRAVAMIFQDSANNFNPVHPIGAPIIESIRRHQGAGEAEARGKAIEALRSVGIGSPEIRIDNFPHEFSGGQRQRAMIALALANSPALLIADEPTTALDATVQAQILDLLKQRARESAMILITHDFGVAAEMCDRILVMYHGRIVEEASTAALMSGGARHPYTGALLDLVPRFDRAHRPPPIPGSPPSAAERIEGCAFRPRCSRADDHCFVRPPLTVEMGSRFACWNPLS